MFGRFPLPYRYALLVSLFWVAGMVSSCVWSVSQVKEEAMELAAKEARVHFDKDTAFRFWVSSLGGLYAPVTDEIRPNPFLSHVPERDVNTSSGKELTLMNPAYILREVMEHFQELYGVRGHITSLIHFRPETAPDPWEEQALHRFEKGETEVSEVSRIDGEKYLRFMRPLRATKACLKCHGFQGYKEGDIRGGVSVSVPLDPYLALKREHIFWIGVTYLSLMLIGLAGIWLVARQAAVRSAQRKRDVEEIRRLGRFNRLILDAAGEGIFGLDKEGRHTFVNPAAARMLGYEPEEMVGESSHPMWHYSHPDGSPYPEEECPIYAAYREGTVRSGSDQVFLDRNGEQLPVEYVSTPIVENGEVTGAVVIFKDIRERLASQRVLQEQKETIEKLLARERYLREILQTVADINQSLITAESQEDLLRRSCTRLTEHGDYRLAWIGLVDGEELVEAYGEGWSMAPRRFPLEEGSHYPVVRAIRENRRVLVEVAEEMEAGCLLPRDDLENLKLYGAVALPLREHLQAVPGGALLVCTARKEGFEPEEVAMLEELAGDIGFGIYAHRRREELRELNRSLELRVAREVEKRREQERALIAQSRLAAMGEMMAAVSHHWRQPLTTVGLMVQNLQDAFEYGEASKEYVAQVVEKAMAEIEQMSRTISDFRNLLRERGEQYTFNLGVAVGEILGMIGAELGDLDIRVEVSAPDGTVGGPGDNALEEAFRRTPLLITGYPGELKHTLINLLNNSRDAIAQRRRNEGTKRSGRIRIALGEEEGRAVLRIVDNGEGLAKEVEERAFEPYFTTREQGQGTGVGLYLAKLLIEKEMGGKLELFSREEGAEAVIRLPLATGKASEDV